MKQLYDEIGVGYKDYRRPDPRIASAVAGALGQARRVVNVGAGVGSYEPVDCYVLAVEPSREMIRQREKDAAPVVQASASHLPFRDGEFDAGLAVLTVQHWSDRVNALNEFARVTRTGLVQPNNIGTIFNGVVVLILCCDSDHSIGPCRRRGIAQSDKERIQCPSDPFH